jgi:RNA polymerase sigma-70 factor, ECF subfamily
VGSPIASTGHARATGSHGVSVGLTTDSGQRAALTFEQVYSERFHDVLRWIRALGGLDADLDDLAQEVFLVVQRRLPDFDGANLGAWLYKIAKNQVSDHKRRAWVRHLFTGKPQSSDARAVPLHIQPVPTPYEALERRETLNLIAKMLNKMPQAQRSAFVLFEIEGYSGEEIAELEGIPVNTAWTRLHHARRRFLELVERAKQDGRLR